MSFWDTFVKDISGVGHYVAQGAQSFGNAIGATFNELTGNVNQHENLPGEQELQQKARAALSQLTTPPKPLEYGKTRDNILARSPVGKAINTLGNKSDDAMLYIAKQVNDKIFSPFISRPISTLGILSQGTPEGVPDDLSHFVDNIKKAYDRSAKVTPMQSIASSDLLFTKTIGGMLVDRGLVAIGGPDNTKANVWSDESIKRNYHDNLVGKWFTGVGDVFVSGVGISVAGKVASEVGRIAAQGTGLIAKGDRVEKLARDLSEGIKYAQDTGGESSTVVGSHALKMASTDNPTIIGNLWRKYSNNDQMLPFVRHETDPNVIANYILADKGYLPALQSTLIDRPMASFVAMGGYDAVRNKIFQGRGVFIPEGEAETRLLNALMDSVNSNSTHKALFDAFMDVNTGKSNVFAKPYFPIEPVLGRRVLIAASEKGRALRNTIKDRTIAEPDGWVERNIGFVPQATVRLIRFFGTRLPRGYVSFTGTRPYDLIDELNAAFDDLKLFTNPNNVIKTGVNSSMMAGEYRRQAIARAMDAVSPTERYNVIQDIDSNIGLHLAMTQNFWQEDKTLAVIQDLQDRLQGSHRAFAQKGYAMDAQGRLAILSPQTQPQLANTYRMIPWGKIEKELKRRASGVVGSSGIVAADRMHSLFEEINKYWAFDVIGKPSYIPKQSVFEPLTGATIATGGHFLTDNIPNMTKNFLSNNSKRVLDQLAQPAYKMKRVAVAKTLDGLSTQLDRAVKSLDEAQVEFNSFFIDKSKSPVTIRTHRQAVVDNLKQAEKLVSNLEREYNDAIKPFGGVETIPTISTLQRRLDYIETTPAHFEGKTAAAVANARAAIGEAKGALNTLMPDPSKVAAANLAVEKAYWEIDKVLGAMKGVSRKFADTFGKTEKLKTRSYGRKSNYRMVDGQWMNIASPFDENAWGSALRAEFSNAMTNAVTYSGELRVGTRHGMLMRHSPMQVTDISDPLYYEELAHLVNTQFRQDPLVQQILAGKSNDELSSWALTQPGRTYLRQFDVTDPASFPSYVSDIHDMVNRYLPNPETQAMVLEHELLSTQLQRSLSNHIDQLSPLHPSDFRYEEANSGAGVGGSFARGFGEHFDAAIGKVFNVLMGAENPIRWAYSEGKAIDISVQKANYLASQGVHMTVEDVNALKRASLREALQDMEKTFYTITRPNRAIYAARIATAFPTATMNAFYRYSRLAVKYPVRFMGFLHYYDGMFQSFGIDQYGNPVKDVLQATHIVVPGTDDIGWFGGRGVRLGTRSIGFLLNLPSPSVYTAVSATWIVQHYPNDDKILKSILGKPMYDIVFPYGSAATSLKTAFVPSYLRDSVGWLRGPDGKTAFMNSWTSVYDYHKTLLEMGIETKFPGDKQILAETNRLWKLKALYEFSSPFGMPAQVTTTPMTLFDQVYYALVNKYTAQGMSPLDASKAAGTEYLSRMGANFPVDRITYNGKKARAYIAPTQEGYNRIFVDNKELTQKLVDIYPKDPFAVGLLTSDIAVDSTSRSPVISGLLRQANRTLPGSDGPVLLNNPAQTPQQVETGRLNNRTWAKYFELRDALDAKARSTRGANGEFYKSMASAPGYSEILRKYADTTLKVENKEWWSSEYSASTGPHKDFIYARALKTITDDEKFMSEYGATKFWTDAQTFIATRDAISKAYNSLPTGKTKTGLRGSYLNWLNDNIAQYDPRLGKIILMYLANDNLKDVS